ncbi:hypothetical protein, partial [Providencia stuartii]|uniref:hypothetical protein n=1 Tax=Providencia stuartii TaxID=588 RepID=UPI0019540391
HLPSSIALAMGSVSEAQPGDALNTTRVRVLFNEPIDAGDITPRDVSIDGFNGEIVAVQDLE